MTLPRGVIALRYADGPWLMFVLWGFVLGWVSPRLVSLFFFPGVGVVDDEVV